MKKKKNYVNIHLCKYLVLISYIIIVRGQEELHLGPPIPASTVDEICANLNNEIIDLANLGLDHLPHCMFTDRNVENVTHIYLQHNRLTSLPKEVGNWIHVCYVDLEDNQLISLPKEVENWSKLEFAYLANNQLTSLPKEVGNWISVQDVHLENNQLTSPPKEVGNWSKLEFVYLANNQLTSLPKEVGNWISVQDVHLNNNLLTSLPKEVGNWSKLEFVYLANNHLTFLPKEVGNWIDVMSVTFENNQLTSLPKEIGNWIHARNVNLENNSLLSLPYQVGNWINLHSVKLKGNSIWYVPRQILHAVKYKHIYESTKRLTMIQQFQYCGLDGDHDECPLCLEVFSPESLIIKLDCKCKYAYHPDCFTNWNKCVLCRLVPQENRILSALQNIHGIFLFIDQIYNTYVVGILTIIVGCSCVAIFIYM